MSQPYTKRTIMKHQIYSETLDSKRDYWVYLPPGYSELVSYPVIYCQDGLEFLNYGRIATQMNYLILEEDLQPAIIVGVHVDLPNRNEEYAPNGSRYKQYAHFFTEQLLPEVERQYPIRRTPKERIIAGDSLGATVSLQLALDRSDLFGKVLSLSGAYRNPSKEQIVLHADLSHLQIYMLIGKQETEVQTKWGTENFLQLNRETLPLLETRGAEVAYYEQDGTHVWGFWQQYIPQALHYLLS